MFSIVIATKNQGNELLSTLKSIKSQKNVDVQTIIMDATECPSYKENVKLALNRNDVYINEPDNGIYSAWNKSIRFIKKKWVIFLGSGDVLFSNETLYSIKQEIIKKEIIKKDIIICDVYAYGKEKRLIKFEERADWESGRPKLPNHQGVIHNKKLFYNMVFDESYQIAADSKFLLEVMMYNNFSKLDVSLSIREVFGVSTNYRNSLLILLELRRLRKELNIPGPFFNICMFELKMIVKWVLSYLFVLKKVKCIHG